MKVLVVGCGSIGTRRAKILVDMGHEVHGSDPKWGAAPAAGQSAQMGTDGEWWRTAGSHMEALSFDVALICTPPDSGRAEQVREIAPNIHGLFIEKPLALTLDEVDAIKARWVQHLVTMGACNLRFSEGVDALREIDKCEIGREGTFHMGQHASYWSTNHQPLSLILDSIHELDLAVWALGPIKSIRGYSTTNEARVSVHHEGRCYSTITLDRRAIPPSRWAEVNQQFGALAQIHIDTDPSMYVREMQHFMDCVEAGVPTCNPIEDAAEVCRWALEVA